MEQNPKKLTQTGTQTSPESTNNSQIKPTFSIGAISKEERVSPKMTRKDRTVIKGRTKRSISPANLHSLPTGNRLTYTENAGGIIPTKEAMSPSVAEALRAVFAAFLWHEGKQDQIQMTNEIVFILFKGIVHDAMACASFLKFHPTLPKQGALVITRHPTEPILDKRRQELSKEERARQRHSVEVTPSVDTYLHIQPSTLESLTRSAANANANRNRSRKTESTIKEGILTENFEASGHGTVAVLPPALKCLVYLWEELTSSCLQVISQNIIIASPIYNNKPLKDRIANMKIGVKDKNVQICEKDIKKSKRKKIQKSSFGFGQGMVYFIL